MFFSKATEHLGSVLVYRFTRTDTKDPTTWFVNKGVQWSYSLFVPVHQDITEKLEEVRH